MKPARLDIDAIKARLLRAGYARPGESTSVPEVRQVTREAQEARADLREHIVEDLWALLDALESRAPDAS